MNVRLTHRHAPHDPADLEFFLTHVVQDFMHFLQGTGLSRSQIHAMLHVFHSGECRVSEISDLAGSSKAAGSQLVERLVKQGLLERTEDPTNRRAKKLRVTQRGEALIRQSLLQNHLLRDFMEALSPAQRAAVHAAIRAVAASDRKEHHSDIRKAGHHA